MCSSPKYSLVIPSRNGIKFLPTCIESIICQDFLDYEIILSDDNSNDGTTEYLKGIDHPNIKVYFPEPGMSMAEHWEWALSHAKGQWVMFLGQDDAVQNYFFRLAEKLVSTAEKQHLRAIMSSRAYYFWPGCEFHYGPTALAFSAKPAVEILSTQKEAVATLMGTQFYFELPQMYTNSLFHCSLIDEIKSKQGGPVFVTHPQDANLAAALCRMESKYLKSEIPLGWIGTSTKSAGLAISMNSNTNKEDLNKLRESYEATIQKSKLPYHVWAGSFLIGSHLLYFWQALIQTTELNSRRFNLISSKVARIFLFALAWVKMPQKKRLSNRAMFLDALRVNGISKSIWFAMIPVMFLFSSIYSFGRRVSRKIHALFTNRHQYECHYEYSNNSQVDLLSISKNITRELTSRSWI